MSEGYRNDKTKKNLLKKTLQKNLKWYNRGVIGANVFVNRLH